MKFPDVIRHWVILCFLLVFNESSIMMDDTARAEGEIFSSNCQLMPGGVYQLCETWQSINFFNCDLESKHLNFSHKNLTCLPERFFEDLIHLETLDLSHNLLQDIHQDAFQGLDNLLILELFENYIVTLNVNTFDGLENIQKINLNHNNLKTFDLNISTNQQLKSLSLAHNKITEINPVECKSSIEEIDLSHNQLENIEALKTFTNLEELNLSFNDKLQLFPYSLPENLKSLNLTGILLEPKTCRKIFESLPNLTSLDIEKNSLDNLQFDNFPYLLQLKKLYVHINFPEPINTDLLLKKFPKVNHLQIAENIWECNEQHCTSQNTTETLHCYHNTGTSNTTNKDKPVKLRIIFKWLAIGLTIVTNIFVVYVAFKILKRNNRPTESADDVFLYSMDQCGLTPPSHQYMNIPLKLDSVSTLSSSRNIFHNNQTNITNLSEPDNTLGMNLEPTYCSVVRENKKKTPIYNEKDSMITSIDEGDQLRMNNIGENGGESETSRILAIESDYAFPQDFIIADVQPKEEIDDNGLIEESPYAKMG